MTNIRPPLLSYGAPIESQYGVPPRDRSDIAPGTLVPFPGKAPVITGKDGVKDGVETLKDWNRWINNRGPGFTEAAIMVDEVQGDQVISVEKTLLRILSEFDDKKKSDYGIIFSPEGLPQFGNIKGLKKFWSDFLFKKVPEEKRESLINFAKESLHQTGIPYAADLQFFPDLAMQQGMTSSSPRMIFTPTEQGVNVSTDSSYYQIGQNREVPSIRFQSEASIQLGTNNTVTAPPGSIHVDIYDTKLQGYVLGRGFINNQVKKYNNNKAGYHEPSNKKEILDQMMERISTLQEFPNKNQEAISLFYIYSALKDYNPSNKQSVEMYEKAVQEHYKNLSRDNKSFVNNLYPHMAPDPWVVEFDKFTLNVKTIDKDNEEKVEQMKIFDDPRLLRYLGNFLTSEYSKENIDFLRDIHDMAMGKKPFDAEYLINNYIKEEGAQYINLDSATSSKLLALSEKGTLTLDDFMPAFQKINKLIVTDSMRRLEVKTGTMEDIKKTNDTYLEEVLIKSGVDKRGAKDLVDRLNKLENSDQPQFRDIIKIKIELQNTIDYFQMQANESSEIEKSFIKANLGFIQLAMKNLDDKLNLFTNSPLKTIGNTLPDYKLPNAKVFGGKTFETCCNDMFKSLELAYMKIPPNDPAALLDFQRKYMLANELANLVANYAALKGGFSNIDSNKAKQLAGLMHEFNTLMSLKMSSSDAFEVMSEKLHAVQKQLHAEDKKTLLKFMGRESTIVKDLGRLATFCQGLSKEVKREEAKKEIQVQSNNQKEAEYVPGVTRAPR